MMENVASQVNVASFQSHDRGVREEGNFVGQEVVLDSRALKWYNGGDREI